MSTIAHEIDENSGDVHVRTVDPPPSLPAAKVRYTFYHVTTFLLTFISYAMLHAARKVFSNVKTTMAEEWSPLQNESVTAIQPDELWNRPKSLYASPSDASVFLGVLDAVFMFSYAVGLFISGILGDRFDLRIVLCLGMIVTSIMIFLFGVLSEWLQIYSIAWYVSFWILNGLAQSTAWPCVVAIMGNWFGKQGRGLIFGVWSACASVGNIIGAAIAAAFVGYGYEYPFLVCCIFLVACAIICFFAIVPSPADVGVKINDTIVVAEDVLHQSTTSTMVNEDHVSDESQELVKADIKHKPITFFQAWLLPGVAMYSICYACLKLVNYSFFFWLPFYLQKKFNWTDSEADLLSTLYDVGGIFGGIFGGLISDFIASRSLVVIPSLLIAIPMLFIFSSLSNDKTANGAVMTVTGAFIGGPANMISAAITADLGRQEVLADNDQALSTVTGIVDGTGSFGAAIGQILIPIIQRSFDWTYVFYFFIIMTFITGLCIVPLFIRELRTAINKLRSRFGGRQTSSYDQL